MIPIVKILWKNKTIESSNCLSPTCYNRIPQTQWCKNNRNLFLVVMNAGKSKVKMPVDSMSG